MNLTNRLWKLSYELGRSSTINRIGRNYSIWRKNGILKNLSVIVNLNSVSNNTIFAYLHVITNFLRTNNAVFIYKDVITYIHFGVLEPSLVLNIAGPNNTIFSNNAIVASSYLSKISSKYTVVLDDCFTFYQNSLRTFKHDLPANLVTL